MPILKVCAVRDLAVEAFGTPIFVRALGEAMRSFMDEVNREGSHFFAHPQDFELYLLAEFDDADGRLMPVDLPRRLATGKDLKKVKED